MTAEGSTEVPAGDARTYPYEENPGGTHWEGCYRAPRHHNCAVARLYECHDEIARLEARLAEVEARYEANRKDWARIDELNRAIIENPDSRALVSMTRSVQHRRQLREVSEASVAGVLNDVRAEYIALRAAVRPLVEAAEEADDYLLHMPFQTETEAAVVSRIRAALADPAIAALLDQQKEQGEARE